MRTVEAVQVVGIEAEALLSLVHEGVIEGEKIGPYWELLDADVCRVAELYKQDPRWRFKGKLKQKHSPARKRMREIVANGGLARDVAAALGISIHAARKRIERDRKAA